MVCWWDEAYVRCGDGGRDPRLGSRVDGITVPVTVGVLEVTKSTLQGTDVSTKKLITNKCPVFYLLYKVS